MRACHVHQPPRDCLPISRHTYTTVVPPLSLSYIYFLGPSNPASVLMLTKPYIHIYIYNILFCWTRERKGRLMFFLLFLVFCLASFVFAGWQQQQKLLLPFFILFFFFFSRLLFTFVYIPRTIFVRPPFGMTIQSRAPKNPGQADPNPKWKEKRCPVYKERERVEWLVGS